MCSSVTVTTTTTTGINMGTYGSVGLHVGLCGVSRGLVMQPSRLAEELMTYAWVLHTVNTGESRLTSRSYRDIYLEYTILSLCKGITAGSLESLLSRLWPTNPQTTKPETTPSPEPPPPCQALNSPLYTCTLISIPPKPYSSYQGPCNTP